MGSARRLTPIPPSGRTARSSSSSIDGPYSNDVIGLTYDALGRLAGRTITGGNETFGYDAINRLNSHVHTAGQLHRWLSGRDRQQTTSSVTNGTITVSTAGAMTPTPTTAG